MRIAVITTSRADWNSLGMVALALREQGADVALLARREHSGLSVIDAEWGGVYGIYGPTHTVAADELRAMLERDGVSMRDLAGQLLVHKPDLVVLCGDRHETLAAAFVAHAMGLPIAHLAGGDTTYGSSDDGYRNAITQLSRLHFPTNADSADNLINGMGMSRVYMLGSPSADRLLRTPIIPLGELTKLLNLPDSRPFILANWQPETPVDAGLGELLTALVNFTRMPTVWVGINPDPGADAASDMIAASGRGDWRHHTNLAPAVYLSALFHASLLIGNSSSGFYEAPYFGTPVINVGDRQRGRTPVPACVIHAPAKAETIIGLLSNVTDGGNDFKEVPEFLYGTGDAARQIAEKLLEYRP